MRNLHRLLVMSALFAPETENGSGGGGDTTTTTTTTETPRVFTQEEVDRIVASRVAKVKGESKGALTASEQAKAHIAQLEAELEETRSKLAPDDATKAEQAKIARENARLSKELADARAAAAAATTQLGDLTAKQKTAAIETVVRKALGASGAHAQGLEQAVRLMVAEGSAEVDDEGVTVTIDKVPYTGDAAIAKAAAAWLTANPHFAKSVDGGSGGRRPNGGAGPADLEKMSARALLGAGMRQT